MILKCGHSQFHFESYDKSCEVFFFCVLALFFILILLLPMHTHGVGSMPREVNASLIVLIPKISNPTSVNHFRLISLCNVVYKIISKLLVEKIRPLLDKMISPAQSAFIPNRWIAENQIIVQEVLHSFKTHKTKPGLMAIKLDL